MPELPEVQALVDFLADHGVTRVVTGVELASFSVLKTFDPPPDALLARTVDAVTRRGKHLDLDIDGTHLIIHLARAGWIRWYDEVPTRQVRPGKGPIALRLRFDDGSGFDLTEAGTRKGLAVWITEDPATVPSVAKLGPDPLTPDFTEEVFAGLLQGRRAQIKGLLRDQSVIAGIGNAYSDEILHVARLSPFAPAQNLSPEEVHTCATPSPMR